MHKLLLAGLLCFISLCAAKGTTLPSQPIDLKFTAIDGRHVDLTKMRGKVVLIDFWATWCPPCRHIAPDIVDLYKKYHNQGLEVIGVSVDSDKQGLLDVVKKEGLVWPQYFDGKGADNEVAAKFGIEQFPTLLLVDKEGIIVNKNLTDLWLTDGAFERVTSHATHERINAAIEKELKMP